MRDVGPRLEELGLHTVVIGNGSPAQARMFREDERVPFALWVDADLEAYRAAGLRRGASRVFSWRSFGHLWRALRGGVRQASVQGDPWQLGGVLLVSQAEQTMYRQVSREAGDHAAVPEILAAAAAAR